MPQKGLNEFLGALFASEGGSNYDIENRYGYIGKYQFGEDALIDTGYYLPDGSSNRDGKAFRYDWLGKWTGKNGAHTKAAFLASQEIQDHAAKDWVSLLCKRLHRYKLDAYIGKPIGDLTVTESGIIAAAHLKGFGNAKNPGVIAFLKSGGAIDPSDANGTHVSKYMRKFAGYTLGCCASCAVHVLDREQSAVGGIGLLIQSKGSEIFKGFTDAEGKTQFFRGFRAGQELTILIQRIEGGYKEVLKYIARSTPTVITLQSPKILTQVSLLPHAGTAGGHMPRDVRALKRQPHDSGAHNRDTGHQRNRHGNPVDVLPPPPIVASTTGSLSSLQEILLRNATCGASAESISGPDAVRKSQRGELISLRVKGTRVSLGRCYKYVKIALQASGMVTKYLAGEHAKDAGPELAKEGFVNLLARPNHGIEGPMDAPIGAVIVYGTTDGSPHGHIEVRARDDAGEDVVVSDYASPRPRTELPDGVKRLEGRGRIVTGIWVKEL